MTHTSTPAVTAAQAAASDEIDLMQLFALLLDRKWWVLGITLVGTLIGVIYALTATPVYRADALLQVEEKNRNLASMGDLSELFPSSSSAATEIEIIRSRMIVGQVVDALSLDVVVVPQSSWFSRSRAQVAVARFEVPDALVGADFELTVLDDRRYRLALEGNALGEGVLGELLAVNYLGAPVHLRIAHWQAEPKTAFTLVRRDRRQAISDVQKQLSVAEKGRNTGVLALSYNGTDRQVIRDTLQGISREYLLQNISRNAAEAEKSLAFLNEQLPQVRRALQQAEERLNLYRLQQESVDIQLETQGLLSSVVALERQLSDLSFKESDLSRLYTRQHPTYVALLEQRQILERERDRLRAAVQTLPETQQEVLRLTRDVQVNQEIYVQMLNRVQELDILRAGTVGNVRIIDEAQVQARPVAPRKALIVALSLVLSGVLGCGVALVLNVINRGIDSTQPLEQAGLTVYASIPLSQTQAKIERQLQARKGSGQVQKLPLLAKDHPTDLSIEALRGLRTSLHFALMDKSNRVVSISGPSPEVGKSFLSANLAAVLAQSEQRVLLIDGDMRRGHLHRMLGLPNGQGLSDYLQGQPVQPQATSIPGLDLISRGNAPPNPSELLMGPGLAKLLDWARQKYDLVLIDTPPLLAVTDAALVARHTSVNLLVARFGRTTVKEMLVTVQRFAQNGVDIQGTVLNAMEQTARNTYAYGGYYYAYRYDREKS